MLQFMGREDMSDYNADFLTMLETWDAAVNYLTSRDVTDIQPIEIANLLGCKVKPPSLLAFSIAHPLRPRSKPSSFSKLNSDVRKARRGAHGLGKRPPPPCIGMPLKPRPKKPTCKVWW